MFMGITMTLGNAGKAAAARPFPSRASPSATRAWASGPTASSLKTPFTHYKRRGSQKQKLGGREERLKAEMPNGDALSALGNMMGAFYLGRRALLALTQAEE